MLWVIEGELVEVQGCIERALDIMLGREYRFQRIETAASREFHFTHTEIADIGKVKISILPQKRTELYGYNPAPPDDKWLVEYLFKHIPWGNLSKPLQALLQVYSWQIEHDIFNLSATDLYRIAHSAAEIDYGWDKYGLDDLELRRQALEKMQGWRMKVQEGRISEFEQILGVIESQIREDGLTITKPSREGTAHTMPTDQSWKPWEHIPDIGDNRGIIEMWCKQHTNKEIGLRYHKKPRSITNIISALRKKYPDAKIPTNIDRRKSMIKR